MNHKPEIYKLIQQNLTPKQDAPNDKSFAKESIHYQCNQNFIMKSQSEIGRNETKHRSMSKMPQLIRKTYNQKP